jgi:recombination protein RecT
LADLVFRAGRATVWTGAVYEGDEFEYGLGDSPYVKHRPRDPASDRLLYVYAVGRVKDGDWPVVEVWPISKVIAHRDKYNKVGGRHYSFQHLEMYARKVALLQVIKYMPKSTEMQLALQLDQTAMNGPQNLTFTDAIDGTWVADGSEDEPQEPEAPRSATEAVKEQLKGRATTAAEIWPKNQPPKDAA